MRSPEMPAAGRPEDRVVFCGGMPTVTLTPLSGRYLLFAEREEIALLRAQELGVGAIARHVGRSPPPSTSSPGGADAAIEEPDNCAAPEARALECCSATKSSSARHGRVCRDRLGLEAGGTCSSLGEQDSHAKSDRVRRAGSHLWNWGIAV